MKKEQLEIRGKGKEEKLGMKRRRGGGKPEFEIHDLQKFAKSHPKTEQVQE